MKRLFILFMLAAVSKVYAAAISEPFATTIAEPGFEMRSTSSPLASAKRQSVAAQYNITASFAATASSTNPTIKGLRLGSRQRATSPLAGTFVGNTVWNGQPAVIGRTADETLGANAAPTLSGPRKAGPGGGFSGGTDIPEPTIVPMGNGIWFCLLAALLYSLLVIRKKKKDID